MRRIGVLGGTFDPIHWGHLRAAEAVRDAMKLDVVLFVPAAEPPHKSTSRVSGVDDRVGMLAAALAHETVLRMSPIEVERGGPSYTIETLEALASENPDAQLFFITGTDAFYEIQTWRRWRELLQKYAFVVVVRPGVEEEPLARVVPEELGVSIQEIEDPPPGVARGVYLLRRALLEVSSTEIRELVRDGSSIRFLLPDAVEGYVREHRLYLGDG